MKRSHISFKTKLAAALLQIKESPVAYEDAKIMTADQIISCFHLDHYPIPHGNGGADEAWNLTWRPILAHREKTKCDVAAMAKTRRIAAKLNKATLKRAAAEMMEAKPMTYEQFARSATPASPLRKRKWPSRTFPKRPSRRLRSGGV